MYTGDTDATRDDILCTARQRFNIVLPRLTPEDIHFVFLQKRAWVEAKHYPLFTLLGQSVGSIVLGFEALWNFVPDVYIDSMGYAFTLPLFRYMGGSRVACYVHYPTISTDMLQRVAQGRHAYNNAGFISSSSVLSRGKLIYYHMFAFLYGLAGKCSELAMVNSSWTYGHITSLWNITSRTHVVYPPCNTKDFLDLSLERKSQGNKSQSVTMTIVSVGQFRPEKDHTLQIRAFHKFLQGCGEKREQFQLVLIGGCRNIEDEMRVQALRDLCTSLGVSDNVKFRINVSFEELKGSLQEALIGVHTMWNEHFGIGMYVDM